jgi:hypothetical protein
MSTLVDLITAGVDNIKLVHKQFSAGGPGSGRHASESADNPKEHKDAIKWHTSEAKRIATGPGSLKKENTDKASAHRQAADAHKDAIEAWKQSDKGNVDDDAAAEVASNARMMSRKANG